MIPQELIWKMGILFLGSMTLVSFVVMFLDKSIARRNGRLPAGRKHPWRRVPERTLFLLAIFGGSVGVLLGMYTFRHKTRHRSFVLGVPAILAAQVLLGWFLFTRLK